MTELDKQIKDAVDGGCRYANRALGFQTMPEGYALMIDHDDMYYFWLRYDGATSEIHWDKWAIRRGAIENSKMNGASK